MNRWWEHAACAGAAPGLMWPDPESGYALARAKAVCVGCPVRVECRDDAIAKREAATIRGGLSTNDRLRFGRGASDRLCRRCGLWFASNRADQLCTSCADARVRAPEPAGDDPPHPRAVWTLADLSPLHTSGGRAA